MTTLSELAQAAHLWVESAAGHTAIFAEQNGERPEGGFLTLRFGPHVYPGMDETLRFEVTGPAAGESLGTELTLAKTRQSTLAIQSFGLSPDVLERVRDSIKKSTFRGFFQLFAPYRYGEIVNITALLGTKREFEERYQLDVMLRSPSLTTDDPGVITSVELEPTYSRHHGDPAPVTARPITITTE